MYVIEFAGLPGSGKSTTMGKLLKELNDKSTERFLSADQALLIVSREYIDNVFRPFIRVLPDKQAMFLLDKISGRTCMHSEAQCRFLARYGEAFSAFLSSVAFKKMSVADKCNVISFFMQATTSNEIIRNYLDDKFVVLFDEGLIQKTSMFITEGGSLDSVQGSVYDYLNHIPVPNILIFMSADPVLCCERMMQRPRGLTERLKMMDRAQILSFLSAFNDHFMNISTWLKERTNTILIEVDSRIPTDILVKNIAKEIYKKTGYPLSCDNHN